MKKTILIICFLGFALQAQSYLYIWRGGVKTDSFVVTNSLKIDFRTSVIMGIPCPGIPTVTYEGKTYNTVQIGTQCWLKENLNVGIRINGNQNSSNNGTIEKYCYNDSEDSCYKYGGLYQWDEAMQYLTTPGTRGICPPGWHIPANAEFETLAASVNNDGNALKAIGQGTGSGQGTNTSGFSALLAGGHGVTFFYLGIYAFFWSSIGSSSDGAAVYCVYSGDPSHGFDGYDIWYGFSVRCVKDSN